MMKKKFACYCSGNASRIIKFYRINIFYDFPLEFIMYDGSSEEVVEKLKGINPAINIFHFKSDFKGRRLSQEISDKTLDLMLHHKIDYLFCFGSKILKSPLIDVFENKIINFHPSLLPAFPGLNAIDQAIDYGVKFLGNTAHFIDKGIDTGEIISQSVLNINEYSGYEDVLGLQIDMLKDIWIRICSGDFSKEGSQ